MMKQVIWHCGKGTVELIEVPEPSAAAGRLLVRNRASLISTGTERQKLQGLAPKHTFEPGVDERDGKPLGYSSAGEVIAVGPGAGDFRVGQRVACSRGGYAVHAEVVSMPPLLCAGVPVNVSDEQAAFGAVGAIALHAFRLAEVELGGSIAVLGVGLIGLLVAQIARTSGCRVLAVDVDPDKCALAQELGAEATALAGQDDLLAVRDRFADGHGVDAVIICASTPTNQPVETAGELARLRGRVVVAGLVGLTLPRVTYYEKELSLVISRGWGPGVFDPQYEEQGQDYPYGYVRWTAQRNMSAFLELVARERVILEPLISCRFPIQRATKAYELLLSEGSQPIAILLSYPRNPRHR